MRDNSEKRDSIITMLSKASGPVSNILYNVVQFDAKYNKSSDRFEIPIANIETTYFNDNPHDTCGIISGTPIHWEISNDKLIFGT